MTMKLPQKAGFAPTVQEWDQLVRIAENLAAQLAQRDAALREMQAERDAAQRDLIHVAEQWHASEKALDAARAKVARLTAVLTEADKSAQMMADQFYEVSEGAYLIDPVEFDAHRQAIRAALRQPAPAGGEARE